MAEKLVLYQFRKMNIAIDGATPKTYAIYRRGGDYNKVIENIKKINYYKKIYNSEYPELIWQFIVFGHNEHEIELAAEKAKELNMKIYYKENYFYDYSPVRNKDRVYKLTGICSDKNMDIRNIKKYNWHHCDILFESPKIDWNGTLHGCWQLYMQRQTFNVNVFEVGLLNALNSKMFVEAKHLLTDISYKSKINNPCANCYYYINFLKKRNYSISKYA